jgi:hypothetical protein
MKKAMDERRNIGSPESIDQEILGEIIIDLFRMILYSWTE